MVSSSTIVKPLFHPYTVRFSVVRSVSPHLSNEVESFHRYNQPDEH